MQAFASSSQELSVNGLTELWPMLPLEDSSEYLKPLRSFRIVLIHVGVVLLGQLVVGLLDVFGRSVPGDAKKLVVVLAAGVPRAVEVSDTITTLIMISNFQKVAPAQDGQMDGSTGQRHISGGETRTQQLPSESRQGSRGSK